MFITRSTREWPPYNMPDVSGGGAQAFDVRPQLLEYGQQGRLFYCPSKWSASMNTKLLLFEDLSTHPGQLEIDYFFYVGHGWENLQWKSPRQLYRIKKESDVQLPGDQVMSSDFAHAHVTMIADPNYAPYVQPLRPVRGNHTLSRGGDYPIQGGNRLYHDGHVVFMGKESIELAATQDNNRAMWFW